MFLPQANECKQENIDAQHRWRRKSVVYELEHITEGYTEFWNRVTPGIPLLQNFL